MYGGHRPSIDFSWLVLDLWSVGALEYWSIEKNFKLMKIWSFGFSITPVLHYSKVFTFAAKALN
jgi:hypothetical protein